MPLAAISAAQAALQHAAITVRKKMARRNAVIAAAMNQKFRQNTQGIRHRPR
jgi:hypothetical protein